MDESTRAGLEAMSDYLALIMRHVAGLRTQQTAAAVNVNWDGEEVQIRAGRPGGAWDWEPIQALMFDNNKRHPLYGHPPWYYQGWYPITGITMNLGLNDSVELFADVYVPALAEECGL